MEISQNSGFKEKLSDNHQLKSQNPVSNPLLKISGIIMALIIFASVISMLSMVGGGGESALGAGMSIIVALPILLILCIPYIIIFVLRNKNKKTDRVDDLLFGVILCFFVLGLLFFAMLGKFYLVIFQKTIGI